MVSDLDIRLPALDNQQSQHDKSVLANFVDNAQALVWSPTTESQTEFRDQISYYVSSFGKTAALFAGGNLGRVGTAALFGLDQAKQNDSFSNQALDFTLGATKGAALRGTFKLTHNLGFSPIATGITLGVSNRFVDGMTERKNYQGATTFGGFENALSKSLQQTLDGKAIATDAILFGTASALTSKLSSFSPAGGAKEFIFKNATAGGVFGMSTGAVSEMQRQTAAGEEFDLSKVLFRGALQGGVDATAAGLSGRYNLHLARVEAASSSPERQQMALPVTETTKDAQGSSNWAELQRLRLEPRYPSNYPGLREVLQPARVETVTMKGQPTAETRESPHPDYITFRASLPDVTKEMHVYKPKGNFPEIAIEATSDKALNEIRQLRQTIEEGRAAGTRDSLLAAEAASKLHDRHPLRWSILPEEIIPLAAQIPEFSGIKRINISNEPNPEDSFHGKRTNLSGYQSQAEITKDGELTLFQPSRTILEFTAESPTLAKLIHEWTHTFRWKLGPDATRYDQALALEPDSRGTNYSRTSPSEDMAHNLTDLLHANPVRMYKVATENPLRSAILAQQLKQHLEQTPTEHRGRYHQNYVDRADAIEAIATPRAQSQLLNQIRNQDGLQASALRMLYDMGWGNKLAELGPIQRLDFSNSPVSDADIARIASPELTHLNAGNAKNLTPGVSDSVAGMQSLKVFEAPYTQVDSTILQSLNKLPNLQHVDLRFTNITYDQIKMWAQEHRNLSVRY